MLQQIDLIKIYKRKTALVIDDIPDMRGSIRRMLVNFGIERVDTASNGIEAIELCAERHYDIILSDYNLVESKSGQQILEELRHLNLLKNTSLYIMITAETTRSMVFGALEYQPDDYIAKPFNQGSMRKRLDRLVIEKEALNAIYTCMDAKNFDKAIELCDEKIAQKDRMHQRCLRLKALCLLEKNDANKAIDIYRTVLSEREIDWAKIGLGKALIKQNQLNEAEEIFQHLISKNCPSLEIYDHLADIKIAKGEMNNAQELLEQAIAISPTSILRQCKLANLYEDTDEFEKAEQVYKKVIRLGTFSCYDSPAHYLGFARCVSNATKNHTDHDKKKITEAEDTIHRMKKNFPDDELAHIQGDIIVASIYANAGNREESEKRIDVTEATLNSLPEKSPQFALDIAKTFQSIGHSEKAQNILIELYKQYKHDSAICIAIDKISNEPLTELGKDAAIKLNSQGREFFSNKQYDQAIEFFNEALLNYPNSTAVNLNLLLALMWDINTNGNDADKIVKAGKIINKLSYLTPDHDLFERYQTICKSYEKLNQG